MSKSSLIVSTFLVLMSLNAFAQRGQTPRPGHQPPHQPQQPPQQQPGPQLPPGPGPGGVIIGSQNQIISERVLLNTRAQERLRLSDLLRLSISESRSLEVLSLSITAQSLRGQAQIEVLSMGRSIAIPQIVRRQLSEVRIQLPASSRIEDLELLASDELMIDTITAEVRQGYNPQPQPQPLPPRIMQPVSGQMLDLVLRQDIRMQGEIPLKQLVRQQLGLSLDGAQIERIVVQGTVLRGYSASVQVEMNNRLIGPVKTISAAQVQTPIPLNTIEEVRGTLRLIVRGDVIINSVRIRVGQVRPVIVQPELPQRIIVARQISSGLPLEISQLLPYENRLISSISIEARAGRMQSAEVALVALGQVIGSTIVTEVPMRQVIQLFRPMSARELRLQSLSPVMIDALEIGFDSRQW